MVDWSALGLPAVLLPAAVVEGREGHGVGAAPATVRLTGNVVAELSVSCGADVLLAAALQRPLVRLAILQTLDDLAQREAQREHSVLLEGSVRHDALVAGAQNVYSATTDFSMKNRICQAKDDRKNRKKPLIKVR